MNFTDFYEQTDRINIPLYFNLLDLNELDNGRLFFKIPLHSMPYLIEKQVIQLKVGDKIFNNLNEACKYYDILNEDLKKSAKEQDKKSFTLGDSEFVWTDENGKVRSFETVATNSKIGSDTVILNMDTAKDCVSARLGFCSMQGCYSLRKEIMRPKAYAADVRQKEQWNCLTSEVYIKAIKKIKEIDPTIKYIRFNESGDFRDENDIKKFKHIADNIPELIFYTYSHRLDLKDSLKNLGSNIVLQGSGFMLDNAFIGLNIKDYLLTIDKIREARKSAHELMLKGLDISSLKIGFTECVGDCSICNKCKIKRGWVIYLPIHGAGSQKVMALRKVTNIVKKNPEFSKILSSNMSDDEKTNAIMNMLDIESKSIISKIKLIPREIKGFYKQIIDDELLKSKFIDALLSFSNKVDDEILAQPPTPEESKLLKQASILALQGKFVKNIEQAKSGGAQSSQQSFEKMQKQLNDLIDYAKQSNIKKVKPSKKLAGHFGMIKPNDDTLEK